MRQCCRTGTDVCDSLSEARDLRRRQSASDTCHLNKERTNLFLTQNIKAQSILLDLSSLCLLRDYKIYYFKPLNNLIITAVSILSILLDKLDKVSQTLVDIKTFNDCK